MTITEKLACFLGQINQNGTTFKEREWFSVGAIRVDDCGYFIVGTEFQEIRLELIALADIHCNRFPGKSHFLAGDVNFVAIGGCPGVNLDRFILRSIQSKLSSDTSGLTRSC